IVKARLPTTGAGHCAGFCHGHIQESSQSLGADLLHRPADQRLDGFQIESAAGAPASEHNRDHAAYFLADLLLDRVRRFFSSGVRGSSTGRNWQIFSLTAMNERLTSWYSRNAAISRSALR